MVAHWERAGANVVGAENVRGTFSGDERASNLMSAVNTMERRQEAAYATQSFVS
jgi:hypothetical protein